MPKSKRAKVVHLSRTAKKPPKELNAKLFATVHDCADSHPYLYVLHVDNMRNNLLKDVRREFSDSRILFGKTKVMAKALCGAGSAENEYMPGMSGLLPYVKGDAGLLFSPRPPTEVLGYFETFGPSSFARAGTQANADFVLPPGVVYSMGGRISVEEDVPLPHSVETTIRKWGVPSRLHKGKVVLDQEYVVCREGQTLDSSQTALLKFFGVAMAEFKVKVDAYWVSTEGKVTEVGGAEMEQ
jgi:mRNA turnover protein 4